MNIFIIVPRFSSFWQLLYPQAMMAALPLFSHYFLRHRKIAVIWYTGKLIGFEDFTTLIIPGFDQLIPVYISMPGHVAAAQRLLNK